ncbi:hypothetical protein Hanom_Chr16g01512701 [Helianthus anomalus]
MKRVGPEFHPPMVLLFPMVSTTASKNTRTYPKAKRKEAQVSFMSFFSFKEQCDLGRILDLHCECSLLPPLT